MRVKTIQLRALLTSLALPLAVAVIGTMFVVAGIAKYELLIKPPLTPPGWVFGVVWTILYVMMGCAAYLVKISHCRDWKSAMQLYHIQLALNLLWTLLFFRFGALWFSAVVLVVLIAAVVFTVIRFAQCSVSAGRLLLPYLVWSCFALYLNVAIAALN